MAAITEAAAPLPAASAAPSTSAAAASSVKQAGHDARKPDAATPAQHGGPVPPGGPADPVQTSLHQARQVKAEAAFRSASPALGHDKQKAVAAAEAVPGKALQAATKQAPAAAPKQADDAGASTQPPGRQVTFQA